MSREASQEGLCFRGVSQIVTRKCLKDQVDTSGLHLCSKNGRGKFGPVTGFEGPQETRGIVLLFL